MTEGVLRVRRQWEPEELIDYWTLVDDDWGLVANKSGATRLGFAVLLKFFELEGRFPRHAGEVPRPALGYVAAQVKVAAAAFADYEWTGRTIEYHRAQIRQALGFHEATVGDEDKLGGWLAKEVCPQELSEERLREALMARCRSQRMEPPAQAASSGSWVPPGRLSTSTSPPAPSPACRIRPSPAWTG